VEGITSETQKLNSELVKCENPTQFWTEKFKRRCKLEYLGEYRSKMKNGVFWDVMPRGSCKNRRFGGT
jgi:hypothetical protein